MVGVSRLADRYQLHRVVGRGGMGTVWAARDVRSGREVAVKTVTDRGGEAGRLRREARLAASVTHPGVVAVHDAGHDGATGYLVMDLLTGPDLGAVLDQGPMAPVEAVRVTARLADALAAVHGAGVVHGDVKPANVVLDAGDGVVLIDFGAALSTDDDAGPVTFGTATYMAPEQVTSAPATAASDVYALGCLLTTALAGRPPFVAGSPTDVLHRQVRAAAPRLRELVPGVPAALDDLVASMLEKDPAARCTSAQAHAALSALREDDPLPASLGRREEAPVTRLDAEATRPILEVLDLPAAA
ncbi:serine/threonine protein kinase [Georgenia sp. 311]|uniref:non-specific serine/threonine protein kinase n=1 Tax=Georgenia wutianyii TaxID=2585135 RepID=A0ABX5VK99_9MICO|nr:serine/threonine protein kinase [Georgenia wutianyii]TNC16715.1 serine/threonine protein kinase [Georgenia sp. 311]